MKDKGKEASLESNKDFYRDSGSILMRWKTSWHLEPWKSMKTYKIDEKKAWNRATAASIRAATPYLYDGKHPDAKGHENR